MRPAARHVLNDIEGIPAEIFNQTRVWRACRGILMLQKSRSVVFELDSDVEAGGVFFALGRQGHARAYTATTAEAVRE